MSEGVWAIDENGKPTICKAKPENRGKRKCNHRFHMSPDETKEEFFKKYMFDINGDKPTMTREDFEEYTIEDLPDYNDIIRNNIAHINRQYKSYSDLVRECIANPWRYDEYYPGVDNIDVVDYDDPEDPNNTKVDITFDYQGKQITQSFTIPKMDDMDQIYINGTAYRCIPVLDKNKEGIDITIHHSVIFKDEDDKMVFSVKPNGKCRIKVTEEDGKTRWSDAKVEDVQAYLDGEESNLSQLEKEAVDRISPYARERYEREGMDAIRASEPDEFNDLTNRPCWTYEDRIKYSISKGLAASAGIYHRNLKNGHEPDFSLTDMSANIRKDLTSASYIQIADNLNPIAAISQSQRVSYIGPNGLSKDDNYPGVRFPHVSHQGIVDTNDVSLGGKVGTTIAVKGHIDKNGIIQPDPDILSGSDFIPYVGNSDPNRSAMAISQMKQAVPIIGGEDPKLSTKGWDAIKGSKIGVNLKVAYIPEAGVFEDAVVISESAAKKMTTVQTKDYHLKEGTKVRQKVGDRVKKGDRVGGVEVKYPGVIKSLDKDNVTIESTYPMTVGDKLAGRYGNKGVVSKILPDDQMPKVDGQPSDLIMSPIGVAGRSNLGQIYEVNEGDFNKKRQIDYRGHIIEGTGGDQFIMRINQIAEKKLNSNGNRRGADREFRTRFGEMENLVLTSDKDRLEILEYIKHQEHSDSEDKFVSLLKSVGVEMTPVE